MLNKFINILMLFWPILGQRKTNTVVFLWKRRTSSVVFLATILFLIAWYNPLEIILAKKTTELLFHKNITKLVYLWPNMSEKSFKVLIFIYLFWVGRHVYLVKWNFESIFVFFLFVIYFTFLRLKINALFWNF